MKAIQEALEPKGVTVLSVPEIPTILMLGGCKYPGTAPENVEKLLAFEENVLAFQVMT